MRERHIKKINEKKNLDIILKKKETTRNTADDYFRYHSWKPFDGGMNAESHIHWILFLNQDSLLIVHSGIFALSLGIKYLLFN